MTRVSAPSRLHFGLLHVPAGDPAGRRFGGCGLMLAGPRVTVTVAPAADWAATGPAADRALDFARRVHLLLRPGTTDALHVAVEACPAEHAGLGVGTALGLAVARAVAGELGVGPVAATEFARLAGRGTRSAVGVHGFAAGGFLIDGGKRESPAVGALVGRLHFPDWPVVLIRPAAGVTWSGPSESAAFARPRRVAAAERLTADLCRLLLLGVAPAVADVDYPAFAGAVYEYNFRAGEPFAADQGGPYASPEVAAVVAAVLRHGVPAAGQSSWGPTVFAICRDGDRAAGLAGAMRAKFPTAEVVVTGADNAGAAVESGKLG